MTAPSSGHTLASHPLHSSFDAHGFLVKNGAQRTHQLSGLLAAEVGLLAIASTVQAQLPFVPSGDVTDPASVASRFVPSFGHRSIPAAFVVQSFTDLATWVATGNKPTS